MQNLWIIPLFPLVGFLINGLFGRRMKKPLISTIAVLAVFIAFLLALAVALGIGLGVPRVRRRWLGVPGEDSAQLAGVLGPFAWLAVLIYLIVALLVVGIVYAIVRRRSRSPESPTGDTEPTADVS